MTKSQEAAINRIRKLVALECGGTYEIKQWEVEDIGCCVSVYVVYGLPNDEGTMAAVIGRDRAHLFVGKRGGITYPVSKGGKQIERRFHGYSILEAVCDQR